MLKGHGRAFHSAFLPDSTLVFGRVNKMLPWKVLENPAYGLNHEWCLQILELAALDSLPTITDISIVSWEYQLGLS